MNARLEIVDVLADLDTSPDPMVMGALRAQQGRGGEIFSFAYDDPAWLARAEALAFDPDLALVSGPQYPPPGRANFGIFLDSSPDRWGRTLMQRRENLRAREEGRRARALTEWDFLLGVHDETRLGALRFRSPEGRFLDDGRRNPAPPLAALRELQAASLAFEQHTDEEDHPQYRHWLSQLFAPGTSLGGARPKATVRDEVGALWIAKFPSRKDARDVGAWELVAHRLAARADINVPEALPLRLPGSDYTTFLARRFDRTADNRRRAFVSAMTLTQRIDGEPGASYLELVDLLQSQGVDTRADSLELFRRVIFNILIRNTDDHLRNHGFFIGSRGVTLSPAYDINPSIERDELTLAINEVDTACDVSIAMEARPSYGVSKTEADATLAHVSAAVATWREEADALGIPRSEQELMAAAFEPRV